MSSFAESLGDSSIVRLVVRRVIIMLPTLLGVTLLLCAIAHFTPGAAGTTGLGTPLSAEQSAAMSAWHAERFGTDEPFVVRYVMWMKRMAIGVDGDVLPMGSSVLTGRSVRTELGERLPATLALNALALALAIVVALPAGVAMALRAGRALDRGIFGVLITLWSVPMVVMATLLLSFATRGGRGVQWLPAGGADPNRDALSVLAQLILPALCLAIVACAPLARQVRAALLEQLGQEYVQTALAKGLSRGAVLRRHVARGSLSSLVTVLALLVPRLIAGSVLVETIFSIDGVGRLAWRSAVNRDIDIVLMIALLTAIAHMVSLLLADVLSMLLDPRVRLGDRRAMTP